MNTSVEVNCPYRDGEKDKYNITVEFLNFNFQNRLSATNLTDILDEFASIEEGISGEDLTSELFSRIKNNYDARELEVYVNTPYDLKEEDRPKVTLYISKK